MKTSIDRYGVSLITILFLDFTEISESHLEKIQLHNIIYQQCFFIYNKVWDNHRVHVHKLSNYCPLAFLLQF